MMSMTRVRGRHRATWCASPTSTGAGADVGGAEFASACRAHADSRYCAEASFVQSRPPAREGISFSKSPPSHPADIFTLHFDLIQTSLPDSFHEDPRSRR